MNYQHRFYKGKSSALPLGKVVCVGRNYAAHALELNNPIPKDPLLFIKPATSVVPMRPSFKVPKGLGSVHFETEIAILIGKPLTRADEIQVKEAIAGIGLALDLTLRDLQSDLKSKGQPWEKAKAFDGACPLSEFIKPEEVADLQDIGIKLNVNGELRQQGNSAQMLNPVVSLLSYISQFFTLEPGDVVLTGTPEGVGPIQSGDCLEMELPGLIALSSLAE